MADRFLHEQQEKLDRLKQQKVAKEKELEKIEDQLRQKQDANARARKELMEGADNSQVLQVKIIELRRKEEVTKRASRPILEAGYAGSIDIAEQLEIVKREIAKNSDDIKVQEFAYKRAQAARTPNVDELAANLAELRQRQEEFLDAKENLQKKINFCSKEAAELLADLDQQMLRVEHDLKTNADGRAQTEQLWVQAQTELNAAQEVHRKLLDELIQFKHDVEKQSLEVVVRKLEKEVSIHQPSWTSLSFSPPSRQQCIQQLEAEAKKLIAQLAAKCIYSGDAAERIKQALIKFYGEEIAKTLYDLENAINCFAFSPSWQWEREKQHIQKLEKAADELMAEAGAKGIAFIDVTARIKQACFKFYGKELERIVGEMEKEVAEPAYLLYQHEHDQQKQRIQQLGAEAEQHLAHLRAKGGFDVREPAERVKQAQAKFYGKELERIVGEMEKEVAEPAYLLYQHDQQKQRIQQLGAEAEQHLAHLRAKGGFDVRKPAERVRQAQAKFYIETQVPGYKYVPR